MKRFINVFFEVFARVGHARFGPAALAALALLVGAVPAAATSDARPATPEGLSDSDWTSIHAAWQAGRHAFRAGDDGHWQARSPGQRWHSRFDGRGFTVTPDDGDWTWGLELRRVGFDDDAIALDSNDTSAVVTSLRSGGLSYQWTPALREWFVNDGRGLQQGWTLDQRPGTGAAEEPLRLGFALRGGLRPQVSADGRAVSFHGADGGRVLDYAGLTAWDADGRTLAAHFEPAGDHALRIAVDERGARYPITIDPIAQQQAYLKASNTNAGDEFGRSVAVSGDTVVVGAYHEDSAATGVNGNQADNSASNAGAAYVFVRNGSTWSQQAYLKASNTEADDLFGTSVAISGDTVVVGADQESSAATGVNGDQGNNNAVFSGAAYVFVRSGGTWSQQAYLKASNPNAGDKFGNSVAVSGDTVVVGAWQEDSAATGVNGNQGDNSASNSGAAYVFVRNGGAWSQQAYLKASNTGLADTFGNSVAVSGDTVVVGAFQEDSASTGVNGNQGDTPFASNAGAAYVFVRNGGAWSQQAYLKASNTDAGDSFGGSVAVSGNTVVVGAISEDSAATGVNGDQGNSSAGAGAAYVFVRNGSTWSQQAYLKASNTRSNFGFGFSVAASGDTVVVGSTGESSAATGVDGNQGSTGAPTSGAAYVFVRNGGAWSQQAYLKASNTGSGDKFSVVAVSGDTVVVGAFLESSAATGVDGNQADNSALSAGAAYIFGLDLEVDPIFSNGFEGP